MKILVWDDVELRCLANAEALVLACKELRIHETASVSAWAKSIRPERSAGFSTNRDLLLVHGPNAEAAMNWMKAEEITATHVVLYSGVPVRTGVNRGISVGRPLTVYEGVGLIEAARGTADVNEFRDRIAKIWSEAHQYAPALRLLCEAWLLCNWGSGNGYGRRDEVKMALGFRDGEPAPPASIEVLPPIDVKQWLAPFGGMDAATISNRMPYSDWQKAVAKFFSDCGNPVSFPPVADLFLALERR